jgi:hypothetical protein
MAVQVMDYQVVSRCGQTKAEFDLLMDAMLFLRVSNAMNLGYRLSRKGYVLDSHDPSFEELGDFLAFVNQ